MHEFRHIYDLHRHFHKKRRSTLPELCSRLRCSRATFMRVKSFMTGQLGAPIVFDRGHSTYSYDPGKADAYELPGCWFTSDELLALSALGQILDTMEPGLLGPALSAIRKRLDSLVEEVCDTRTIADRIRLLPMRSRPVASEDFCVVAGALLTGSRLTFVYEPDAGEPHSRTVSPLRLVRYRDNWYLDAWCHQREGLRSFGLSRLSNIKPLPQKVRHVPQTEQERFFADSYGIFSGPATAFARIRFSGVAARYAARETWHPKQQRTMEPDGSCILAFPYGDPRELVKDILAWGPDAEVLDPPELREEVRNRLILAAQRYQDQPR